MPDQPPQQVSVSSAQFIASAMLLTPWVLAGVATTYLMIAGGEEPALFPPGPTADLLKIVLLIAGIGTFPVSFVVRRILTRNAPQPRDTERAFSIAFISMGMSETPTVIGFILAILTGDLLLAGLLWGIGFAGMLFHWPTRRWLEGR